MQTDSFSFMSSLYSWPLSGEKVCFEKRIRFCLAVAMNIPFAKTLLIARSNSTVTSIHVTPVSEKRRVSGHLPAT